MARRLLLAGGFIFFLLMVPVSAAFACGGLVAPGHAEVLEKATTLSAWHAGYEHYVTGFRFAGSADRFGYIVPLPGVPSKIEKGGDWTLERLEREVSPFRGQVRALEADAALSPVQVVRQVRIDALDITVVRGGGRDVAAWAERNGFALTPDAPQVLGQYASRGSVFALARFDRSPSAGRRLVEGQGETIHFTIPTKAPWIPLRILALGKAPTEAVDADLFVLTDGLPSFSPPVADTAGLTVRSSEEAKPSLLNDLRSDRGMSWLPASGMWLTAISLQTNASAIRSDLSIDGGGPGGFAPAIRSQTPGWTWWAAGAIAVAGAVALLALWRPGPASVRPA